MYQAKTLPTAGYFIAAFSLLTIVLVALPASAANGDIIISRDVQPRAATRQALVPDPNPQLVNPQPNNAINIGLRENRAVGELNDSEFAAVHSGTQLPSQLLGNQMPLALQPSADAARQAGVAGHNPVGHSGNGALGNVGGQVNRSVQQGLRPLQILQR
ncbi:MAG: hypothetical protein ACJAXR_001085 [Halopseudomonas sp.]|jgi:hypothetical protein|uniref:hypothetical protein n=1 Tax=Halopseudomonas sp. TaxID=2901191 RepID=UPI0039E4A144